MGKEEVEVLRVSRREVEDWFPNHPSSRSPSVEACCGTRGCDEEESKVRCLG